MKHLGVLTFAVVAAFCIAISHGVSSRYGIKGLHDRLLHREYVVMKPAWWWWSKVTTDVVYPPSGYVNAIPISAIYVIDQTGGTNTTTGYGSLSKGGPGSTNVTIHLKSHPHHGLNFTVEIYGASYQVHHG